MPTSRRFVLAFGALVALAATEAQAQYFGRNPVQWQRFKYQVLKTEHFDIYYYPEEQEAVEQAGRMAERWYTRLSRLLDHRLSGRQPLLLYASQTHFQQTNAVGGQPGEGTGGVTEVFKRRIVLPFGASLAETDHVLGHELVHAFQFDMTGQGRVSDTNVPSALRMPLWFIEGMAEYLSLGPVDPHTAMWMRDAARQDKLPTIRKLGGARYFPYRYGQALWAYLAGRFGDKVPGQMLKAIGPQTNDAEAVLQAVLGIDHATLSKDWHAAIKAAYEPLAASRQAPSKYGHALITEKAHGGRLNVGPALSPDGQRLVFLSERELFSVELFLADARTGDVTRRLSKQAVDPHLESLQFINSAGSWDPQGRRLALGAISNGKPVLAIVDAERAGQRREVRLPELNEVMTPTWSPDGKRIAFSAMSAGDSDLYVYDLVSEKLRRLTHDAFADLQPAWSPDGKSIAFVTDRFSTRLQTLDAGNYRLASIDPDSGDVRALPSFETAKNINPQWAPGGASLYFLSDRDGATNVYRLELASNAVFQVTDLLTGASGITGLSPALASAAAAERLAFSAYEDGRYDIYTIDAPEALRGTPVTFEEDRRAALIPGGRAAGDVLEARQDARRGLADAAGFTTQPYKPKLTLDYVGQPYLAAGADRFGTFVGGGASLFFSDMLGEHTLGVAAQVSNSGSSNDFGGILSYVNRTHRFNWGAALERVPYVTGAFAAGFADIDGQRLYVEQTQIDRQIEFSTSLLGYYPFSRSERVEVNLAYRHIGFDSELRTQAFDPVTGGLVLDDKQELPRLDALDLTETSAAFVRDTSVFGATSPVLGQRFRLEAAPTFGSIHYTGILADFRQYVMPARPFTLAGRVLHYGRYGSGGEDPRFRSLFVGYPNLVRGYDVGSFNASECVGPDPNACPVFDQLLGSRLLVANLELRFPLAALFGARNLYGPLPIEVGAFFDSGVAWFSGEEPKLFGGERKMVRSVGATARLNLFGFAVLQLDYAKPLDRPGKRAFWQFNLIPGF